MNVAKTQVSYWKRWVDFCTVMKTQPIRADNDANSGRDRDGYARECALLSAAYDYGYEVMKGRRTAHPNPGSVRAWIAAIRTIKLLAAGVDELTIRSMVRWQNIGSLVIYCRMTPEAYAGQLAKALKADAKSVQTTTLHDVGLREDLEAGEVEARQYSGGERR